MDADIRESEIESHKDEILRSLLMSNMEHPFSMLHEECRAALRKLDYDQFEQAMIRHDEMMVGMPRNRAIAVRRAIFDWYRYIYQ